MPGRTELARAIFGADKISTGTVQINGKTIEIKNIRHAIAHKIGLVPEDRKKQGLVLILNLIQNTTLASLKKYVQFGKLNLKKEKKIRNIIFSVYVQQHQMPGQKSKIFPEEISRKWF